LSIIFINLSLLASFQEIHFFQEVAKALILLLIVGVLMVGTFSVIEEASQEGPYQDVNFSDGEDLEAPRCQDPIPTGEGGPGGGGPPAPG